MMASPTEKTPLEVYREQSKACAKLALDYYNKNNGTNYELLEDEPMESYPIYYGLWYHCNFKAKDSGIERFFGEIYMAFGIDRDVTSCQILKDETHLDCDFCQGLINHPVDGYKVGRRGQCSRKVQVSCTSSPCRGSIDPPNDETDVGSESRSGLINNQVDGCKASSTYSPNSFSPNSVDGYKVSDQYSGKMHTSSTYCPNSYSPHPVDVYKVSDQYSGKMQASCTYNPRRCSHDRHNGEMHDGCEFCSGLIINHPVDKYKVCRGDRYSGKIQYSPSTYSPCTYNPRRWLYVMSRWNHPYSFWILGKDSYS